MIFLSLNSNRTKFRCLVNVIVLFLSSPVVAQSDQNTLLKKLKEDVSAREDALMRLLNESSPPEVEVLDKNIEQSNKSLPKSEESPIGEKNDIKNYSTDELKKVDKKLDYLNDSEIKEGGTPSIKEMESLPDTDRGSIKDSSIKISKDRNEISNTEKLISTDRQPIQDERVEPAGSRAREIPQYDIKTPSGSDTLNSEYENYLKSNPGVSLPKNPLVIDSLDEDTSELPNYVLSTGLPTLPKYFGPNSLRHPEVSPKSRTIHEISFGGGANETRVMQVSSQVRVFDHLVGLAYERAQWLDVNTNTGKFTESYYFDYCAPFTFDTDVMSFIPCYRYGTGEGRYKERGAGNELIEKSLSRDVFKVFARAIFSIGSGSGSTKSENYSLEVTGGYSQDAFLLGGFSQIWIKTPIPLVSVGAEVYDSQRLSFSLSLSSWL